MTQTDIFADTIAEMTWYEVDQAAKDGAVLLWAFGVIEQHGPHLPTGTDVYIPQARLREVKRELAQRGVKALIVPPYYWGVNVVSGAFPASYKVRPEIIRELMADVFASLKGDGFQRVFCFSGHGDALHNRTIHEGVKLGVERTGMDISFVMDAALAQRLGIPLDDAQITLPAGAQAEGLKFFQVNTSSPSSPGDGEAPPRYVDVHAGRWESSMMLASCASLVRDDVRRTLKSTDLGPDDLAVWRKGFEHARRTTPLGYFGDPAAASAEEGERTLQSAAATAADAIVARIRDKQ
ncbi:creatininase family protein [Ramlibacter henchirensis]|uniref:Creatininase family protein n=1 Tax=Ramlibacter henchirensis TaxID=204072 RepID=A0A4Z0BTL2_9BURK|nr:creatininase family protein [Ramlibacter henchirensis]TFZ02613.1 creatininase family protein [Ramlibacter henchirensis]